MPNRDFAFGSDIGSVGSTATFGKEEEKKKGAHDNASLSTSTERVHRRSRVPLAFMYGYFWYLSPEQRAKEIVMYVEAVSDRI